MTERVTCIFQAPGKRNKKTWKAMIYALKTTLSFYLSIDTTFLSTCNKSQDSQESCNKVFIRTIFLDGFPRWHGGKEPVCQKKKKKEPVCQCRRCGFDPWVRKIPWSRKWQHTPVFLPAKSHGHRGLMGYNPRGCKESDMTKHKLGRRWGWHLAETSLLRTVWKAGRALVSLLRVQEGLRCCHACGGRRGNG